MDLMEMLGFNKAIDQLAMESNVRCHGYVMWRVLAFDIEGQGWEGSGGKWHGRGLWRINAFTQPLLIEIISNRSPSRNNVMCIW